MKYGDVKRDNDRQKALEIHLPGVSAPTAVLVRAVSALEEGDAISKAIAAATKQGSKEPQPGDPLYDAAWWAQIVATAYLDADSPAGDRQPFFASADEVLRNLPTDALAYLFQLQQSWQEEVSPTFKTKNGAELVEAIKKVAGDTDGAFFGRMSPFMQWSCARFMATLLMAAQTTKSPSSSLTAASTTTPDGDSPKRPPSSGRRPTALRPK